VGFIVGPGKGIQRTATMANLSAFMGFIVGPGKVYRELPPWQTSVSSWVLLWAEVRYTENCHHGKPQCLHGFYCGQR
jgi:hypothetical protein